MTSGPMTTTSSSSAHSLPSLSKMSRRRQCSKRREEGQMTRLIRLLPLRIPPAIRPLCSLIILVALLAVTRPAGAQKVNVTLFTESQCPFCTRLLREQIWQFHTQRPGIMNLQIIPFGKGNCEYTEDQRLLCRCMHGPTECDLNRLQNCAISYFPRRHLGLVTCIQGLANLDEAFQRCLSRLTPRTQRRLMECAKTQTGEVLNYYSMLNTHRAGVRIWPTAYVNGQFFDRSYPMENEICRHTDYC